MKKISDIIRLTGYLLMIGIIFVGCQQDELILIEEEVSNSMETLEIMETKFGEVTVVMVHICGEVMNPGVYQLGQQARVVDAIETAGGFTANARTDYLNLADRISDGEKVYVPSIDEVEQVAIEVAESKSYLVNINQANQQELMALPGIGEAKASDIITYREQQGRFLAIEEIKKVPGIKEALFFKIKDLITVD